MIDEASLLAAVLASPDSDEPRLALADWYSRRGDVRGELIRVQIALAQAGHDPGLKQREEWLLEQHAATLLGPLAAFGLDCRFERGFVTSVTTTADRLLACAEPLFQFAPVQELCLKEVRGRVPRFAACPHLRGVRRLFLTFNALTADDAASLARSEHLNELTTLNLGRNQIGDAGLRALAESAALPGLRHLWIANNGIGDAGVIALARSPLLRQLQTLRLNGNPVGDLGLQALATSPHAATLTGLHIGATRCTEVGALALAGSPHLGALCWLVAKKCPLSPAGEQALRERLGSGYDREALT